MMMLTVFAWAAISWAASTDQIPDTSLPRATNPAASSEEGGAALPERPDGVEGARLEIDAKVPVEILIGGVKLGQLYYPGEAQFKIVPGEHVLRVYVNGRPTDVPLVMRAGERTRVLVGRSGVSLEAAVAEAGAPAAPVGPVAVQFRLSGGGGARLMVDGEPVALQGGQPVTIDLGVGNHRLSVRSVDGTAIWATGQLEVQGGDSLVVQVAEGRMPEVSGPGRFR
jgi:hypothetical protein